MPQDGLRSALYRSLVTCDDPKGVVTCRPLRRSKSNHSHQMENRKKRISFSGDSMEEEIHSPASFQLMEVSRGAQKLNRTIERWSVGARSSDVASDLLRGAIDLQDSLAMLGKLQEASRFMARIKRERHDSDGAELKRVIRESLMKQRLVSPKEKAASASASRAPNLIAKLMGLEHYPSSSSSSPEKLSSPEKRRTLNEILDSMHFKGLLLGSDSLESLDRSDDGPPIVLMKPLRIPCLEEDDPLYRRKIPRKPRERALKPDVKIIRETPPEKEVFAKPRASSPVKRIPSEGFAKRVEKIPKPEEKDIVKRRSVPKLDDQAKKIPFKARNAASEPKVAKIQNSRQPSAAKRSSASNLSNTKKNDRKKEKPVKKPVSANSAARLNTCERSVELSGESECREVSVDTNQDQLAILEDQLLKEQDREIEERCGDGQSHHSEATASSTAPSINGQTLNPRDIFTNSLAFKTSAEELFDLDADDTIDLTARPIDGSVESGAKLLVDCAIELMKRRSLTAKQRRRVSLATLVEEASDGIEALRSFADVAAGCVYAVLERDMVSGTWDASWRDGFRPVDTERVVIEVETMVLSGLIEEVFA